MSNRPPHVRLVSSQAQTNPLGTDWRALAITVALTAGISTAVTMLVQNIAGRMRRTREEAAPAPQGFLPPFVPGQAPMQGHVVIPAGGTYFPPPRMEIAPSNLPPSLQVPREGRRREHVAPAPANDVPPAWFASFAKQQEQRFAQMEQRLETYGDDEYDDDEATG